MHLSVSDVASWYAERYPDFEMGAVVPGPCALCFIDLEVGDLVVTRQICNENNPYESGQVGYISKVWQSPQFGRMFVVSLTSGHELLCPRSALKKQCDIRDSIQGDR